MQVHQLRYFLKVAQTASFTVAAQECNVSQPTLSQQIKKLEDELGSPLFHRLKNRITLTDVGERFYERAVHILEEIEAARQDVDEFHGLIRGRLRLGVIPTIAPYLLPEIISRFNGQYPDVELEIQEDLTPHLLRNLLDAQIDLALLSLPIKGEHFEIEKLFADELLVTLPAKHSLGLQSRLTLADLSQESFILMKEGHCLGDQTMEFCEAAHANPRIAIRSSQIETIHALITAGLGISLTPRMAVKNGEEAASGCGLVFRPVGPERLYREIVLVWRRNSTLSTAARTFRRVCQQLWNIEGPIVK